MSVTKRLMAMAMVVVLGFLQVASGDCMSHDAKEVAGNWYCNPVTAIQYSNVGYPGTYSAVVNMLPNGDCVQAPVPFSGPLSPLNEELSVHFRGPIHLKQFAAYVPSKPSSNKRHFSSNHARRHELIHHKRAVPEQKSHELVKRTDKVWVTDVINDHTVSWINNWFGPSSSTSFPSSATFPVPAPTSTSENLMIGTATSSTICDQTSTLLSTQDQTTVVVNDGNDITSSHPIVWVTATIDGATVSWINNWFGPSTTATPVSTFSASPQSTKLTTMRTLTTTALTTVTVKPFKSTFEPVKSSTAATTQLVTSFSDVTTWKVTPQSSLYIEPSPTSSSGPGNHGSVPTGFTKIGYYDSASQTLDNLVFLGNYGGQGSGCWNKAYGASLAYANSSGTGGSKAPEILQDGLVPSNAEFAILLDQKCEGNDCGYVRPDSVAYHGFDGADKIFLFEFSMPHDITVNAPDMPAIWLLNANIARTVQYGSSTCSCWETGCGEFDVVEALSKGSTYLKSTLHTNTPGGSSDYIERPTQSTMKLAVVFTASKSTVRVQVLSDDTDFSSTLTSNEIEAFCSGSGDDVSDFKITT